MLLLPRHPLHPGLRKRRGRQSTDFGNRESWSGSTDNQADAELKLRFVLVVGI